MPYLRLQRSDVNYFRDDWNKHYIQVYVLSGHTLYRKGYNGFHNQNEADFIERTFLSADQIAHIQLLLEKGRLQQQFRDFGPDPVSGDQTVRYELFLEENETVARQIYRGDRWEVSVQYPAIAALEAYLEACSSLMIDYEDTAVESSDINFSLAIAEVRRHTDQPLDFRRYDYRDGQLSGEIFDRFRRRGARQFTAMLSNSEAMQVTQLLEEVLLQKWGMPSSNGASKAFRDPVMSIRFFGQINGRHWQANWQDRYTHLISQSPFLALEFFESQLLRFQRVPLLAS